MAKGGQTTRDPVSPELKAAWKLKETGDFMATRREVQRLLAGNPSAEDKSSLQLLLDSMEAPLHLYGFAGLSLVVMAVLVLLATRY
jgi:hypothetical protein